MAKSIKERKSLKGGANKPFPGKKGSGSRFDACTKKVGARKGVHDAKAVCAAIGRSKYGNKGFAKMGARGRK